MARKRKKTGGGRHRSSDAAQNLQPRQIALDWVLAFLLVVSAAPNGLSNPVRVLPSDVPAVLAPDWAWSPPLSKLSALQSLAEWPFGLYAAAMALVIALVPTDRDALRVPWVRYSLLVGLSLLAGPADLLAGAIVLVALQLLRGEQAARHWLAPPVILLGAILVSLLASLEFSVIGLLLLCEAVAMCSHRRSVLGMTALSITIVLAVGAAAWWHRGLGAALARPVSWVSVSETVLPMNPFLQDEWRQLLALFLLAAFLFHAWREMWRTAAFRPPRLLLLTAFSLLALSCTHYAWIALFGIACLTAPAQRTWSPLIRERVTRWCAVATALVFLLPALDGFRKFTLTGRRPPRMVDPSAWQTSGRVLLMNPAASSRWQAGATGDRFRLLVDDRWDVFRDTYPLYAQVCRDLREIRSSRYLRTDGKWGGYKRWTGAWKPTLLVLPSHDLDAIRRLSLSPHWNVMGVDSRRTILGAADVDRNQRQIRNAALVLSELEWPSPRFDGSFRGVIAAADRSQRRRVAEVLRAMRLPYAALRVMLPGGSTDDEILRAKCHLELAHRVYRQTRAHTLLDQYRALHRLRRAVNADELPPRQILLIARGLEALRQPRTAIEFASHVSETSSNKELSARAGNVLERCRSQVPRLRHGDATDAERDVRRALRAGDRATAEKALAVLRGPRRRFFKLLTESPDSSPEQLYLELVGQLNRAEFPADLRAEALFYLGSLAIEFGDSPGADDALSASMQADPELPFNSISRISLGNLRKHRTP